MIDITPEIMGPGIEEEYVDALEAIDDIRLALGPQDLTNNTPEGRVLLNTIWVEQEIRNQRLPIPVDKSFVSTIFYLVGSNELAGFPGFQKAISRLWLVLKGYGLMKARHVPVLISMMDDFISEADTFRNRLDQGSLDLLNDIRSQAEDLRRGGDWAKSRPPSEQFGAQVTPILETCMERCFERVRALQASLFQGWRPTPARKAPMPAPVPGLPSVAPRLPPELEGSVM